MNYFQTGPGGTDRPRDDGEDMWIFSYADLMSLLLAFFILLFSFSTLDEEQFQQLSQSIVESFKVDETKKKKEQELDIETRKIRALDLLVSMMGWGDTNRALARIESAASAGQEQKALKSALKSEFDGSGKQVFADPDKGSVEIVLPDSLLFASGQHNVKPQMRQELIDVARFLKSMKSLKQVEIIGHSDSVPLPKSSQYVNNFALSSVRAGAVAQVLIDHGVEPDNIRVRGMGSLEPMFPEKNDQGRPIKQNRAKNRRVHLIISRYVDEQ